VIGQFTRIVKEARTQFVNEKINERLESAISVNKSEQEEIDLEPTVGALKGVYKTQEEIDGYNIVKAILREVLDIKRVVMRDAKNYCGILLDDNNRKPICRLRFNHSKKYLGLMSNKNEERVEIVDVDDIFTYADRIQSVISEYESQ